MRLATQLPYRSSMLSLPNPILTASGTSGYGLELTPYGNLAELGGIVLKGISLQPREGNAMPRITEVEGGLINAIGLQNYGVQYLISHILPKLALEKCTVFANLYAHSAEDFGKLAEILSDEECIAGFEVNVSCPNVKEGGIAFGQNAQMLENVVKTVVQHSGNKAVCIKLTPNITDIAQMAHIAEDAGADYISCINTVNAMAVDIYTKKPKIANIYGGLSGPCIKHIALQCVHKVAKAVSIPIIGIGGITSAKDILEFILVGASAVQIGTATFMNPTTPFQLVQDLEQLCTELQIENVKDYRGTLIE